uniref:Uncharacterized protein n=1 Tax=Brassica oleracea var. oleracea TaxID=109376 RepID=A0A0D3B3L1_BRAOL
MEEEFKNLIKVWVSAISSVAYCYFLSTRIKAGVFRLHSVLPVCAIHRHSWSGPPTTVQRTVLKPPLFKTFWVVDGILLSQISSVAFIVR